MNPSKLTEELLAADEARYQALYAQDAAALADMLADGYLHTHANGKTDDKPAFLDSIRAARYRFVLAQRSAQTVRAAGSTALLSGLTDTTIEAAGQTRTLRNAFVTVWVRQPGHSWQLLHWQATKIVE
jgi:ketosteroid isomerase-like protein